MGPTLGHDLASNLYGPGQRWLGLSEVTEDNAVDFSEKQWQHGAMSTAIRTLPQSALAIAISALTAISCARARGNHGKPIAEISDDSSMRAGLPVLFHAEYGRRYSSFAYGDFVVRSTYVPSVSALENSTRQIHASADAISDVMIVLETSTFLARVGQVVLLKSGDGVATAFANRCDFDFDYPKGLDGSYDRRRNKKIKFCKDRNGPCREMRFREILGDGPPAAVPPGVALYRVFDNHDLSLLYFEEGDASAIWAGYTAGVDDPEAELRTYSESVSFLFGQKMVALSQRCFDRMSARLAAQSSPGMVAQIVLSMLIARGVRPLVAFLRGEGTREVVGAIASEVMSHEISQRLSRGGQISKTVWGHSSATSSSIGRTRVRHRPQSLPDACLMSGKMSNNHFLADGWRGDGAVSVHVEFVGVMMPEGDAERRAAAEFISQAARGLQVQFVTFEMRYGVRRGMVFVPGVNMVLNYELVRHGLLRLDVRDQVIEEFPELIYAASQALREGRGFVGKWRRDHGYLKALDAVQACVARGCPEDMFWTP